MSNPSSPTDILLVIASYLALAVSVVVALISHRNKTRNRFTEYDVKFALMDQEIKNVKDDVDKKANSELVNEQFKNITQRLDEIKEIVLQQHRPVK